VSDRCATRQSRGPLGRVDVLVRGDRDQRQDLDDRAAERGCRHAVLETTSHGLAQGYARAWRFDLGVFTNLSPDHFTIHASWEHYLAAKAQLAGGGIARGSSTCARTYWRSWSLSRDSSERSPETADGDNSWHRVSRSF
jgi:hypothetical protein